MVELVTTLLLLAWEFFKTGLFAIGGGLATVPFFYDIANRYDWLDAAIIPDMIAISESTPGPIGVNMATYAGYNAAGIPGALTATLFLVLPSMIIIIIVSKVLAKFAKNPYVDGVFYTLRPAVTAMIAAAFWNVLTKSVVNLGALDGFTFSRFFDLINPVALILAVAVFFATNLWKKLHPIVFILAGAAVGIIFKM